MLKDRQTKPDAIAEAIQQAGEALDLYERVHAEMEEGKEFEAVDCGLRQHGHGKWNYEAWQAYMQGTITGHLRNIVLTERHYDKIT